MHIASARAGNVIGGGDWSEDRIFPDVIKALNNNPGIYSARLAKKHGSFSKAMKFILKKMKTKKNRSAFFVCSL